MVLRSLHPAMSPDLVRELRRHLGDLNASLDQLRHDATGLLSAQYEEARCAEHAGARCRICPADGPLAIGARRDAARAARNTLRIVVAAQLIDVFHASDPSLTVDELMSILGDAWAAMHGTGREDER